MLSNRIAEGFRDAFQNVGSASGDEIKVKESDSVQGSQQSQEERVQDVARPKLKGPNLAKLPSQRQEAPVEEQAPPAHEGDAPIRKYHYNKNGDLVRVRELSLSTAQKRIIGGVVASIALAMIALVAGSLIASQFGKVNQILPFTKHLNFR